uniref:Forkhead box protein M1 n=1 Tax=Cynoglossus semilaevis TaxID=244447 RepID=A0A3P8VFA5_CYNSE
MRRSPRRPLILRRRKLPFQQNDGPPTKSQSQSAASGAKEISNLASTSQCFPDGVRIMNHPSMSDTQVVVIPKEADLQTVIEALSAKGKESGTQGPNKFILLSENSSNSRQHTDQMEDNVSQNCTDGPAERMETLLTIVKKEEDWNQSDDILPSNQQLGEIHTPPFKEEPSEDKENENQDSDVLQAHNMRTQAVLDQVEPESERPPYSYMAIIQFAINSKEDRRMTLKEIYTWIEDHFPYFRKVAKPGWKNSIRHNLSLHDMFSRETSANGKVSFWTIRPEVNRCLTLDQVYTTGSDPRTAPVPVSVLSYPNQLHRGVVPDVRKTTTVPERRMKPLLPRTDSYLVPIQLPISSPIYLSPSSAPHTPCASQPKRNVVRSAKKVRIAPKVTKSDNLDFRREPASAPVIGVCPKAFPKTQASRSRRKQQLVHSQHEDEQRFPQQSIDQEFSFKTPIKASSQLISSTPSKPPSTVVPEPWKVTPVGKGSQNILDFSPIRTPGGPAVTPRHEYNTFSFNGTPFKDWPLFNSPREILPPGPSRTTGPGDPSVEDLHSTCLGTLPLIEGTSPTNHSFTEGLVLNTMNDSLSKILVDISFSGLEDEELGVANISWSEIIPQFM